MYKDYILLLISHYYPFYQHFHVLSHKDFLLETDVADFLKTTEQQVSKDVLDNIYAYASTVKH